LAKASNNFTVFPTPSSLPTSELKQEWGKDYDNRMEDARKAFKDMGLEEDVAEEVGKLLGVGNTVKLSSVIIGISISY
jgi:hypothetical protein